MKFHWNFIEISLQFNQWNFIDEISVPYPPPACQKQTRRRRSWNNEWFCTRRLTVTFYQRRRTFRLFFRREMTQQWHFISSWNKVIVKRSLQSSRVILFSKILVPKYAFQFQESRCWTFVFLFYWTDLCATGAIILQSSDVFCFSLCILTNRWPGDHSSDAHTPPHACYWE
jgi:hypothetical protein